MVVPSRSFTRISLLEIETSPLGISILLTAEYLVWDYRSKGRSNLALSLSQLLQWNPKFTGMEIVS